MYRSKATQKLNNIAYALIIGGALGNLFDRLWHGFVVDMIDFYVGDWHFATFNLADSAICIGAALIVLEGFLPKEKEQASMPGGAALTRPTEFVPSVGPVSVAPPGKQGPKQRAICMSKSVQSNSAVLVHFTLKLDDGSTAESTRNNGKPALFRLGDTLSEGLEQQLLV
jgi:hypothetical protein